MLAGASGLGEKSPWYRCYVLTVLLIFTIHNMATRNLPSYLVTVQVPGCEGVCNGVASAPLCGTKKWDNFTGTPTNFEVCQICRSGGGSNIAAALQSGSVLSQAEVFAFALKAPRDANYYNMADGACMHDWQYGLLIGYGFALVFGIGSIPAGWVCDRRGRVDVASMSLLVWSVATSMQATSHDFWSLVGCRAVIGFAQAFAIPAAVSIGSDLFESQRERQNMAMAVLSVGFYLGSGCASFSIWFAQLFGWRWAVLIAGTTGIALAGLLQLTVKEPARTEFSAPLSLTDVRESVFVNSRVARWCLLASAAKMLAAFVLGSFLPIWYSRQNLPGYSNVAYAGCNALIIAAGGLLATFSGSWVSGYWRQYDYCAPCWVGVIGSVLSIPLVFSVVFVRHFVGSMICLFALVLVSEGWFAPTIELVQRGIRKSHRAQAVPMFITATTLGANLGPALIGFMDPGDARVGVHIVSVVVVANIVAAVGFLFAAREIMLDPVAAIDDHDEELHKSKSSISQWLAPF